VGWRGFSNSRQLGTDFLSTLYLLFESSEKFQLLWREKVCTILVLINISSGFARKEGR